MNIQQTLKNYLTGELLKGHDDLDLSDDDNLLTGGLIDSLGIMRLVDFIEQSFNMRVRPDDVTLEHFRTIDAIAAYIDERSGVSVGS